MKTTKKSISKRHRVANDITAGMRELQEMIATGKSPQQMGFTVRTVEVPAPGEYRPNDVVKLRNTMAVSQAVFAQLVGVSKILVQSWEGGQRSPAPVARRLLDTIAADPSAWLATVQRVHQRPAKQAG